MQKPFDLLGKGVGKAALETSGRTDVQFEVSRDAQYADLRHDPDPARGAERARLGLLGRIAAVVCLIEVYAHAPSTAEIRACLGKHLAHWNARERQARAQNEARRKRGLPPEPFVEPWLWILAATVSAPLLRKLDARAAPRLPAGVYFHGGDLYRVGIVVAGELPRDRETLLVRLMAGGPGLAAALADSAALPTDAHEHAAADEVLLDLEHALAKKQRRTLEEEEFIVSMQSNWELARDLGAARARTRDVLTVLRARGIAVSDTVRERILCEMSLERLERWLEKAAVAVSVAEVIDDPS